MERDGVYEFETATDAVEAYETAGRAAQVVVKETAKAMIFDAEEYADRVDGDVIETARDALFASLLVIYDGSHEEFDEWVTTHPEYEPELAGSPNVDRVVWHPAVTETVVAASYQHEPEAAAATVRRRAFGRCYRELFGANQ